jgi:hypothetical protein
MPPKSKKITKRSSDTAPVVVVESSTNSIDEDDYNSGYSNTY